jgi:uncharacterized membrane protein HdeD (DUF308 family)
MDFFIRHWWIFVLRGLLALVFGFVALAYPAAALTALVLMFGIYAFADGVMALVFAFRRGHARRGWAIFEGITGIGAGLLTLFWPGVTAIALYAFIAARAVFAGIAQIVMAVRLRREIRGEAWLIAQGVLGVGFGVLMIALPIAGVIALVALIAAFAFMAGGVWIGLGLELRRFEHRRRGQSQGSVPTIPAAPRP